jgi:hypothetical protein
MRGYQYKRDAKGSVSRREDEMRGVMRVLCVSVVLVFEPVLITGQAAAQAAPERRQGITRFEIVEIESPTFEGRVFGNVGQYEKIIAVAHALIDPADPRNARITDIEFAPRNANGMVEISADVHIIKPVDMSRSNRRMSYNVANRGNKGLGLWLGSGSNDPTTAEDAGTGFLMNRGYTLVWSGWEDENLRPPGDGRVSARLPVARNPDGSSIVGEAIYEHSFDTDPGSVMGTRGGLKYSAATLDQSGARMLVRNNSRFVGGPLVERERVPNDVWSWVDDKSVRINRGHRFLAPYDAGAAFEFIYLARDPVILGLGFAAVRDVVSFLRHDASNANPLRGGIDFAFGEGGSQSGRWLRSFVYDGFNEDIRGRKVFEGVMPRVAGAHRLAGNERWGDSDMTGRSYMRELLGKIEFPFTYGVLTDPVTGVRDGLFARCLESNTCPNVMQVDQGAESWLKAMNLLVTDGAGNDIELPDNVRFYFIASTPHGNSRAAPVGAGRGYRCQQLSNPTYSAPYIRALYIAMDQWASEGIAPPESQHPRVSDGTFSRPLPQSAMGFPKIPGVNYTGWHIPLAVKDKTSLPNHWIPGKEYVVLVPRTDEDGNDIAGIRPVEIAVPLATYTGWDLRSKPFAENEDCEGGGQFIPFATTRQEREATGDPRRSMEERYVDFDDYRSRVERYVEELMQRRLVLAEDEADLKSRLATEWVRFPVK